MENQAVRRSATAVGHIQRRERELGVDSVGESIAHNFPGTQILDNGQIQPAFTSRDVGGVSYPSLIRAVKGEISLQQIRRDGMAMVGICGSLIDPPPRRADSSQPHLLMYALARAAKLRLEQMIEAVQAHSWIFLVQLHQALLDRLILPAPLPRFALEPAVIPAA